MTEATDDVIDVALRVASAIEESGGTYFVGGSVASSVDGEPRATNDIDFVIDLPLGRIGDLRAALLGLCRSKERRGWTSERRTT